MELTKRQLAPWFLLALVVIVGWVSFRIVRVFLDYVLLAMFVAYLSYPVYKWMLKHLRRPMPASLATIVLVVSLVLVPLGFIIAELIEELRVYAFALDADGLQALANNITARFSEMLGRPPPAEGEDGLVALIAPRIELWLSTLINDMVEAVAAGLIGGFVLVYVLYYLYIDGPRVLKFIHDILPMQEAHRDLLFHDIGVVTRAVVWGQFLTSLIQASIGAIGFWIFGVPNVVLWSVVMFVLALLPLVGPPLVWGPWGIYFIMQGETFNGVGLIIYGAILVSTIDNIIRPKLIGDRAHVHPVVVLLGVLGGVAVFGFTGLILGPLVLSVFITVLNVYRKEFAGKTGLQDS